jgi:hypothetical protein
MNDEEWRIFMDKAERRLKSENAASRSSRQKSDVPLNVFLAALSPFCLLLAFLFPGDGGIVVLATIWIGGGLWAFVTLIAYGYSNKVTHEIKEAALSFLLGNLLVFFVFVLKPT